MPKVLLYITAKVIWNFLFRNTDYYENRAHVHVVKRSIEHFCKIWLEPIVKVEEKGELTSHLNSVSVPVVEAVFDEFLRSNRQVLAW